ncbi:PREDICTED: codanin-1 [Ceratosolen solmsi marchali]|uniref:Codanin-1 n=1 Tax=Ceratosolen solmsi marchali TaxID=326594 RepID=A0AAJ6YQX3_9HYME|nr:PREDICTED: codanin-1 [Ceratosolen solmsi marchali]
MEDSVTVFNKPIEISNSNSILSNITPQTSTPIIQKCDSAYKKNVELLKYSPNNSNQINNENESFDYEKIINMRVGKDVSFDNISFPSLGESMSSSLNVTTRSSDAHKNEFLELYNSNISENSLSMKDSQKSVLLLENNSSMLNPINVKCSQNGYNSSLSNNSYFQENNSTSERNINNISKNSKISPRQNICLGDFIGTEIRSLKKGNSKKHIKIIAKNTEHRDNDQNNVSSNSIKYLKCNRRRKVNPTRLNNSDEKGNTQNIFGTVSRPFTQNPQFVNVSPIDKSIDNASFEVERKLVKKERERKSDITNVNTETALEVINEQNLSNKLLFKTSHKINQSYSAIIPDKALVKNVDILDILVVLYNRFLDFNLIVNPMTELYFIIQLITIQYKNIVPKQSSVLNKITNIENHKIHLNNESDNIPSNILVLQNSLKFDDLQENNVKNINYSNVNNEQYFKTDELTYYNLIGDTNKNINSINKKLKQFSENNNDYITDHDKANNIEELNIAKDYIKKYLDTPHNCVYFSTQVLYYQKPFLKCLDRVTLKLLCENTQIITFHPDLSKCLDKIYHTKVTECNQLKCLLQVGTVDFNVSFQIDTDNRENFPSAVAFQCFRKQRDMFYEILKIWEDNHLIPGWKFQVALNSKIRTMLTMHADVTNFTHFTRLFKSQMLISCIYSNQQEDLVDNETLSFVKNLKDSNPEKLTKLSRKLVTPLSQSSPVPLPSFTGTQEFYKDFILYSSHPMFYTYLENTFIHEIMELNDSHFVGSDIEKTESEVDQRTKQSFSVCLSSLRLLSKFLGFMTSLPYRSETSMIEDVIKSQIILRSKSLPRIDLEYCLQNAAIQGKLSLTVPWVIEYLAMMDHASLQLPYYKRVLEILYCIYRTSNYHSAINLGLISQKATALIRFTIGWLFELPIFPKELYFSWQSKYSDTNVGIIYKIQQPINKLEYNLVDTETSIVSISNDLSLDKLEIIDERILYNCCPFLKELSILLTFGNATINNNTSYRHITPVTSQLQKPSKKINTKHLEIQLEEAFFHGQAISTRKTVEYISERVASNCIKYIYNNLFIVEKRKMLEALKGLYEQNYHKTLEKNFKLIQIDLQKDINTLSVKASENIKKKCDQIIQTICEYRVIQSIESLLSEDCSKPVKNMCVKIAIRLAMERIDQWIHSHIIRDTIFTKDMDIELNRILKPYDELIIDKHLHNPNATNPSSILHNIRSFIWDLIETNGSTITMESLSKFLNQLYESLMQRSDLKYISEITILSLSIDLCLFLIIFRNDLFTSEIQEKFFKIWKIDRFKYSYPDSPLSRLLSPRNIMLMMQADNDNVWINCGKFLSQLLKMNVLSIDALSEQAVALFRNEWTITITKKLSMCLNEAINRYRSLDEETERIRYLLEWVAETYNDMEHENFIFE